MRRLLLLLGAVATLSVSSSAGAATTGIKITRTGFSPKTVTIGFGDSIVWTNTDTAQHQIVADSGSFASPILKQGQSYTFTFKTAGKFPYHDAIRPSLRGTVTVKGPPPSLTIGASAPIVVAGQASTIAGTVSNQKTGENVTVYAQPYGTASPVQVAVVQTVTGGSYSYTVTPAILTSYFAQWKSVKSAPVSVQVKPKLTFMPQGRRFYTKVLAPDHSFAGRFVYLQRRSAFGQWVTIAKLKLGPLSGRLFAIHRRRGVGFDVFRVYITVNQAGAGFLDGSSGTQKLRRRH
jgi:plastocyanin